MDPGKAQGHNVEIQQKCDNCEARKTKVEGRNHTKIWDLWFVLMSHRSGVGIPPWLQVKILSSLKDPRCVGGRGGYRRRLDRKNGEGTERNYFRFTVDSYRSWRKWKRSLSGILTLAVLPCRENISSISGPAGTNTAGFFPGREATTKASTICSSKSKGSGDPIQDLHLVRQNYFLFGSDIIPIFS